MLNECDNRQFDQENKNVKTSVGKKIKNRQNTEEEDMQ